MVCLVSQATWENRAVSVALWHNAWQRIALKYFLSCHVIISKPSLPHTVCEGQHGRPSDHSSPV